ncbi:MAG: 1-deoxy-D-xylulose-5-phosphate reductoisomerase [Acholeplasmataceae bacterium]|nr:MAG: 1-deoxy-D-xylulose-5-phosphate reductoisomerase [Acholeplasmataceae bacterium]
MTSVYLLGAAGSIGRQTIEIISQQPAAFKMVGLSLGSDDQANHEILTAIKPIIACLRHEHQLDEYVRRYPGIRFVHGGQGLVTIARHPEKGILVNALSGSAGLRPTVAAIETGKDIALANKETLVMAGSLVTRLANQHGVRLLPIDSEHSAIWQTLAGETITDVAKIIITASGGAFRDMTREQLKTVTIQDALNHPNWSMGAKITVDSATMMNKGLEIIEAHHLFGLDYDQIDTVLHRESIVHGMTVFKDGTVKASLSQPDMRIPIAYALHHPRRHHQERTFDLVNLSFEPLDLKRYPLLALAYQVGRQDGILPTVMNGANEAAVKLFLEGSISFPDIETIVFETVNHHDQIADPTLDQIIDTDRLVQADIRRKYEKR